MEDFESESYIIKMPFTTKKKNTKISKSTKETEEYSKELKELETTGFLDKNKNRVLLKKHNGDIMKVVDEILDNI